MEMLQNNEKCCPALAAPKLVTITTGTAKGIVATGKNELKCKYLHILYL